MLERGLILTLVFASGCAKVVVDDGAIDCLHWIDGEHAVDGGLPTDGLACAPVVPGAQSHIVPANGGFTRTDACTGLPLDGSPCPDAASIAGRFQPCFESDVGEACGPSWGGACTRTFLWSLCGPDPAAEGGCCYQAIVVTSTWLE